MSEAPTPIDWIQCELGELTEIILGGTPSTEIPDFWGGTIPWMSSGDVHMKIIDNVPGRITKRGLESSNARLVSPPTVAVALAGQGKTRGTVALVRTTLSTNQSVALLRPIDERLDARFLYYNLDHRYEELRNRSMGGGRAGLSGGVLAKVPIALPPRSAQQRIADMLDSLDTQVRLTSRIIAKLEQVGLGLMNDLLSRGVDRSGRIRPIGSFETRNSDAGSFPASWTVVRLDQIADVERGKFGHRPRNDPMYLGGPFPFIQTGDIAAMEGGVIVDASQSLSHLGAAVSRSFPAGTIAVTIAANIADTAMLGQSMYFPDSVVGVRVWPPNRGEYVQFVLRAAKPRLEARAPQSAQRNINLQDLRPLQVPLPEPAEQARICAVMKAHSDAVLAEREALAKIKAQKAAILGDLLTGRVRIPAEVAS
ncbi:restriction endonuclease subunit S [Amycolatopsis benzoatilytica]|uniref:restriction endonuclease subunit S n=1 Tax=Amycolatopsis benzoatilytica TaxID=346045 RepID=UPI0009FC3237|nr:restriction endonuclease subunit S [Amycolatopsis benzoatilytica]